MNDLRPVALTSVAMKVLEKIAPIVSSFIDPLQFAYRNARSTEDAIIYKLEKLYSHLEGSHHGNHARIMYFDFSSAFNTIQPHILVDKLMSMNVPQLFIALIYDFLTMRSQFVKLNPQVKSSVILTNTGAPQGVSHHFFLLYISLTIDHMMKSAQS